MTKLNEAFAIIEVLVVIAMPAVIFYPDFAKPNVVSKRAFDLSNLRQ